MKTVGYFDKNDKTIWSYPFFLIRKNIVHVKLQPRMQALATFRLGWRLKYLFWFYMWLAISASCELDKSREQELEIVFRCSSSSMGNVHILYNSDGIVKYSVIHHLWWINSAQLCNKKFQSICWSHNATLFITYAYACKVVLILTMSSMSQNSEASHVSFLNQTLLQNDK